MKDIIEIVKSLEHSSLFPEGVSETIQNEAKEQRGGFLSMLLSTLGASLIGNVLAGKGINRAAEGIVRAGYGNKKIKKQEKRDKIMKTKWIFNAGSSLTNFEIQKYYLNEPRFNGVYSKDNLQNIKDGAYIKNFEECSHYRTHWVVLYVQNNDVTYFGSFGVEHIPKEIGTFISNKNIKTNIFRIQAYDSVMCRYFCIGFIDFMLLGKNLTEFTNLF